MRDLHVDAVRKTVERVLDEQEYLRRRWGAAVCPAERRSYRWASTAPPSAQDRSVRLSRSQSAERRRVLFVGRLSFRQGASHRVSGAEVRQVSGKKIHPYRPVVRQRFHQAFKTPPRRNSARR
jgi:hypothetical protein